MRTVGVEEELLLVDGRTGRARSVASRALAIAAEWGGDEPQDGQAGGAMQLELQEQQMETGTAPQLTMSGLDDDLRRWRRAADLTAREAGARIVATGTSPLPVAPQLTNKRRYAEMTTRFGLTAREQLTCGCHVHVAVDSLDEAVGVMDRVRGWMPVLLALSSNSPFWQGEDSGYASFRSQMWVRWPSAGPTELFGTAAAYRAHVDELMSIGVLLDEAMIYSDIRPSHHHPTIEIRVSDVCLDIRDTTLVAALCRGLVETASAEWRREEPPLSLSPTLLRLANWQASRYGLTGKLFDPRAAAPVPARTAVERLVEHVAPALRDVDDLALVEQRVDHVLEVGNGATRQLQTWEKTGRLLDVVTDLANVTVGQTD